MELDGHPTEDIIEELRERGAVVISGTAAGPDPDSIKMIQRSAAENDLGLWVYLPKRVFDRETDESNSDA